jgi:4-amino-4-deoxy-L-arabinose transferase-like glycosyltransferase
MPLMEPDEARYSLIPSLMNQMGDYITPHLNHVVYLEKPPLMYWATAIIFQMLGENDFSSRLFVGLCSWGCVVLVYFMGTFLDNRKTGIYSAGVLSTFLYFFIMTRLNTLDIPLTFFVCLATWAGYRYCEESTENRGWCYLLYGSSALAFLTKGLIGIVFPFAIIMLWLIVTRQWRLLLKLFSPAGIIIFLVISLPWLVLVQMANHDFLWFFFVQEHFLRYTTTMHGKENPFYYYIPVVILGTLPWCAFLPEAIKQAPRRMAMVRPSKGGGFLLTWFLFILLFFSLSSSKLVPYIAPAFLPIAVVLGHIFRLYDERENKQPPGMLLRLPGIIQSALFIITLFVPLFLKKHGVSVTAWLPLIIVPFVLQVLLIVLPPRIHAKWNRGWFVSVCVLTALFLSSLMFPLAHFLTPYKSAYPVARVAKTVLPPNHELYQYGISLYGIEFYTKIRTPIVDDFGELGYGIKRLPPEERSRYFLTSDDFFKICKEKSAIYCVTKYLRRVDQLKQVIPDVDIIWDNGAYYILRLNCPITQGSPSDEDQK